VFNVFLVFAFLRATKLRFTNFLPEKSIPKNFYPACPTRPVAPADGIGVGPADRIGVEFLKGRRKTALNRGFNVKTKRGWKKFVKLEHIRLL
jgi:hypothetical protein